MHLAGKTNAGDVFASEIRGGKRFVNSDAGGVPPIFRMLLCPADLRRRERLMICHRGRNQPSALIDDESACAARANVNPEYVNKASSTASSQQSGDIIYSRAKLAREGRAWTDSRRIAARSRPRVNQLTWLVIRKSGRMSKLAY